MLLALTIDTAVTVSYFRIATNQLSVRKMLRDGDEINTLIVVTEY